jgi:hypothetical protein
MRVLATNLLFCCLLTLPVLAQNNPAPIYVTLWFDTEDYILPQSDDAALRLAKLLTRLGVKATFKIVGEKARVLEQHKRFDVIAALKQHEIGFHANTHSGQPTIAVYLQHTGWEDGSAEFVRREGPGVRDIERLFGVTPICYGQPGSSWAPQSYPALRQLGVRMYLDESNHVGIDEQPFYFGGMLNVTKMRSNVVRMELSGADNLSQAKAKFQAAVERLRARGGGTISIYYHPCEFIHTEFWDGVNFRRGANPPRSEWKLPGMKPAAEIEKGYNDFEQYVKFIQAQRGVQFVTAAELMRLYADRAAEHSFGKADLQRVAQAVQREITFQQAGGMALSGAEAFWLLNEALLATLKGAAPQIKLQPLDGPAHEYRLGAGSVRPTPVSWSAFAEAVRDTAEFCRTRRRLPDAIWIGSNNLSPQDYLATLGAVVETMLTGAHPPAHVPLKEGRLTATSYIAEDSPRLWGWVIFPEGFHAPRLMELARLQAWTLKPALLKR